MSPLNNNKGFSILEATIGMGIVSLSMMAFAGVANNMSLTQNANDARLSTNALASSLIGPFSTSSTCTTGLSGLSFDPTASSVPMTFNLPNKVIGAGTIPANYNIKVTALSFTNYTLVQNNADGSAVYYGDVLLSTTSQRKVIGSNNYKMVIDSVYITVASNKVATCSPALDTSLAANAMPTTVVASNPTPVAVTPTFTVSPTSGASRSISVDPCDKNKRQ